MDSGKKVKKKRQRRHSYKRGASHSREPKLWKPGEPLTPTDLDLLSGLQGAYRHLNYVPSQREVPNAPDIKKRFRTWGEAIAAAGLPRYNDSRQMLLRQQKKQAEKDSEENNRK